MEFGEKLHRLLIMHDVTQSSIAELCGIKAPTVSVWINQKEKGFYPKVEYLQKIASYFSLTLDDLVNGDIEMKYHTPSLQKNAVKLVEIGNTPYRLSELKDIFKSPDAIKKTVWVEVYNFGGIQNNWMNGWYEVDEQWVKKDGIHLNFNEYGSKWIAYPIND